MKSKYNILGIRDIEKLNKERKDKKVIFTNGCFDILHYAHMKLLHVAKSHGDILVIGLNSDKSVKLNKGSERPILNENQRMYSLHLFNIVDYIILFDEKTPMELIKKVNPDILVKGKDWQNKIVGEDYVLERGGEIILVDLLPDISTSIIIDKCRSMHSS